MVLEHHAEENALTKSGTITRGLKELHDQDFQNVYCTGLGLYIKKSREYEMGETCNTQG